MIARTRPYIDTQQAERFLKKYKTRSNNLSDNVFFLNSGQACLSVFLKCFQKELRVGIQVFTCPTVLNAITEAGCEPVFLDISRDYFSSTLVDIEAIIDNIDVLVLTHVFGIPNPEYLQIKKLCKDKNVIIIDDLCQTYHAKVNGAYIEDLSENYFYSFFYDKPIPCASGGMLKVDTSLHNKIASFVDEYPKEYDIEGRRKIRRLINVQNLLDPDVYKKEFRTGNIFETYLLSLNLSFVNYKVLFGLLSSPINKVASIILPRHSYSNVIKRMSDVQIAFIFYLFESYKDRNSLLMDYFVSNKLSIPKYLENANIDCSCSQRAIVMKENICIKNAEIKLYNWPELLDRKHRYPNAEFVIRNYVNIPIV